MRVCACGCGASLDGRTERAHYAFDACRARVWKEAKNYVHPVYVPQAARNATRNARTSKPRKVDMRPNPTRIVREMADAWIRLYGAEPLLAQRQAEDTLRRALTPRQLAALKRGARG